MKIFSNFNLKKFRKIFKSKQNSNFAKTTSGCPIALQWIISEECLKSIKDKPCESFESQIYDGSGFRYSLVIYPNGKDKIGQVQIFLRIYLEDAKKIDAEYIISIESAKYSNKMNHIFEKSKGWGKKCCSTEKLFDAKKKFIINGFLTVKVEGILKVTKLKKEKEGQWNSGDFAVCLWNREGTKDFTIIVENSEIKAHKIVLSTCSPVFDAMFESTMKEATENKMYISDFTLKIVEAAIKLCYHRTLLSSTNLSIDDKISLLFFYDKYDIQHPKEHIENLLIKEITSLNVCKLANCAILTHSNSLKRSCLDFLRQCLKAFVPISDFDDLDKDFAINVLKNSFHHVSKTI
uniref:BTB domain-containing protein n=1 Tax=Panagrolaimus davidi TaxID=227884 RepID=A0A914PAW3_9BILA